MKIELKSTVATREAYGKALAAYGQEHKEIVVMDADLSKSTKTADFAAVCPERFFNAGIAEQNMMAWRRVWPPAGKRPLFPPLRCLRPVVPSSRFATASPIRA